MVRYERLRQKGMFLSVNATLRTILWRILPGLLLGVGFACRSAAQAPEAPAVPPGIAIYKAFSVQDRVTIQPALDEACSQAVEDFYLKPVLHVSASRKGNACQATLGGSAKIGPKLPR